MLKIRLRRSGAKKKPYYHVVVSDSRKPPRSTFVDRIGHYDPGTEPSTVVIDQEKVREWVAKGAQMSGTVARLLKHA